MKININTYEKKVVLDNYFRPAEIVHSYVHRLTSKKGLILSINGNIVDYDTFMTELKKLIPHDKEK